MAAMAVGAILGAAAFFAFFDYTEKWGNLNENPNPPAMLGRIE